MNASEIMQIFKDTAYIRVSGSPEERKTAEYLKNKVAGFGLEAVIEPFDVAMAQVKEAHLVVDGEEIPCLGYRLCGSGSVEAPLYYLSSRDPMSLAGCRGKIVLIDGYLGYWIYQDILENGAVGFITYSGYANYADCDIDNRELRPHVSKGRKLLGANINAKTAIDLIRRRCRTARITIDQEESAGQSHNVILDLPGEVEEYVVLSAHYDSVPLSVGTYDNMSGCVGLLALAEYYAQHPHRFGLRFVWCGSEERGLLGSKAYCAAHEEDLQKAVLNINLDMIGSIMGKFIYCVTAEEKLGHYIEYLGAELGFGITGWQGVYSSDSTPFADHGVPSLSFARDAESNVATIHNRYDTIEVMSGEQMVDDIAFIRAFTDRMVNARICPVARKIPDNMKEKLDYYLCRKREQK